MCTYISLLLLVAVARLTPLVAFAPAGVYPRRQSHQHTATQIQISPSYDIDINVTEEDDLTKEELLLRLSETRSYYRKRSEEGMTQDAICLKLLCTRLPNLHLNRSFVADSTIPDAGYGLFASRDIMEGELITLYPGDAVLSKSVEVGEGNEKSAGPISSTMFGSHIATEYRDINRVLTHEARGYEMEITSYTSIVGNPTLGYTDRSYIGHFANDGGYLREFDDAGRKAYENETLERYNAANFVLEGAHMGTVATKPIKKGSEVFLSYGEGYWLSRSDSDSAGKERANILVDIERNMEERRKIKRATTLTSAGNDGRGSKKKKKSKRKKSSMDSAKTKGFGK